MLEACLFPPSSDLVSLCPVGDVLLADGETQPRVRPLTPFTRTCETLSAIFENAMGKWAQIVPAFLAKVARSRSRTQGMSLLTVWLPAQTLFRNAMVERACFPKLAPWATFARNNALKRVCGPLHFGAIFEIVTGNIASFTEVALWWLSNRRKLGAVLHPVARDEADMAHVVDRGSFELPKPAVLRPMPWYIAQVADVVGGNDRHETLLGIFARQL
jgi:hypothetical protein